MARYAQNRSPPLLRQVHYRSHPYFSMLGLLVQFFGHGWKRGREGPF
jgi:hypothetical protein